MCCPYKLGQFSVPPGEAVLGVWKSIDAVGDGFPVPLRMNHNFQLSIKKGCAVSAPGGLYIIYYICSISQGSSGSKAMPKGLETSVAAMTRSVNRAAREAASGAAFPAARAPAKTAANRSPVP